MNEEPPVSPDKLKYDKRHAILANAVLWCMAHLKAEGLGIIIDTSDLTAAAWPEQHWKDYLAGELAKCGIKLTPEQIHPPIKQKGKKP